MLKLRRVDIEHSQEILNRLNNYIEEIKTQLQPDLIILFGSFASGDINEASDIDLLVVAPFKEPFLDRIKLMLVLNTEPIPLEPVGYTPEEFEDMVTRGNPFITEVLEKGRILHKTDQGLKLIKRQPS
ncbi:MAG: nucleotidyltransferase domain-containing protein [Candidatus Caldarchaeum sp.]